jgi:hypothetical protein
MTFTSSTSILSSRCTGDRRDPGEAEERGGEEAGGSQGPPGQDGEREKSAPGRFIAHCRVNSPL